MPLQHSDPVSAPPLVTIGLFVRNGGASLQAALVSLTRQHVQRFTIVVSDNASTDDTQVIAETFARHDPRVTYVRHDTDLGIMGNAAYVLRQARTPYFAWAAADDTWAPEFLSRLVARLEADPRAVACQSRVLFLKDDVPVRMARGTTALSGDAASRIRQFLEWPEDNSRFYGVFRTEALLKALPDRTFYAYDWAVSAMTLTMGDHLEEHAILMVRDETEASRYRTGVSSYQPGLLGRLMPLWPMSRWLLGALPKPLQAVSGPPLAKLNLRIALRFASYGLARLPYLGPLLSPGLRERAKAGLGGTPQGLFLPSPRLPMAAKSSIVLVVRNDLETALERLTALARILPSDTECVVADQGSSDMTAAVLNRHPGLRFVELPPDVTLGAVAVACARASTGERLILIDPGSASGLAPETLAEAVLETCRSPGVPHPVCIVMLRDAVITAHATLVTIHDGMDLRRVASVEPGSSAAT